MRPPLCAPASLPSRLLALAAFVLEVTDSSSIVRSWQGIEQQALWLGVDKEDLPIDEILDTVRKQVSSDKETGSKPPLQ